MIGLIVNKYMTVKSQSFNKVWETIESTNNEWFFLQEAQSDLDKHKIEYTIGEVEIKQDIELG